MAITDGDLTTIITALRDRLGRLPTENEVMLFIFGTEIEKFAIWNLNKIKGNNVRG